MERKADEIQDNTMNILNQQLTNISAENQFLTFKVADEEYGVDVLKVQEIIRYREPTSVPNTPDIIKGVLNFRGEVIPIIDIRQKFNFSLREYDNFTVIIALEIGDKIIGVIVDEVSDIVSFSVDDIQSELEFGSKIDTEYIKGMAKLDKRLIILLYLDKLLSFAEEEAVGQIDEGEFTPE
ncbi:chemotaxis protein CheW [Halanaerocella petrolearia]